MRFFLYRKDNKILNNKQITNVFFENYSNLINALPH